MTDPNPRLQKLITQVIKDAGAPRHSRPSSDINDDREMGTRTWTCQECGGLGEYVEEYIEEWPRYESCGWCAGTGRVVGQVRGLWLAQKAAELRKRRKKEGLKPPTWTTAQGRKGRADTLWFIMGFIEKEGYAPTLREIQHGTHTSTVSLVRHRLTKLRVQGKITFKDGESRTIRVLEGAPHA